MAQQIVPTDLIYEGITTVEHVTDDPVRLVVPTDLIYEGITTPDRQIV